ncbi:MAG: trypsin-like serine peptidase [Paracoccaceae bacterium]
MLKSWIFASVLTVFASVSHAADSSALKALLTGNDSRGWEAVGRLNFAGKTFCTGSLIATDLVLTAAHCLFDRADGRQFRPDEIEFLAGWRNGRANAQSGVRRTIPHPEFELSSNDRSVRVANDLALLQLSQPIRKSSVQPFETQSRPRKGAAVGVVSYGWDRAESPSIQEVCYVLARRSGTLVLSCDVDFGSSGAPIFTVDDAGVARIVSVISAKAEIGGRSVSLGSNLQKPLGELMAILAHVDTFATGNMPGVRVLNMGNSINVDGAKFVRP